MRINGSSASWSTMILTVTGLVSQGLGFVYRILLARLIGPETMGLYQLVTPVYALVMSLTAVGLTAAVSHLTARCQAMGERGSAREVLRRCLRIFLCLFAAVAAAVALFSDPISACLLGDARTRLGLLVLLPCILLTGVENLYKHAFYGGGKFTLPAVVELLEQWIRAGAVLSLLLLFLPQNGERTVGIIAAGMCVSELFSSLVLTAAYRRREGEEAPGRKRCGRELERQIRAVALPVACTSLLGNLLGAWTSVLIPKALVRTGVEASQAMASFGVLCGMTLPMLMLPTAFLAALSLVMTPRLARYCALGQMEKVRGLAGKALFAVSAIMMPALALLTVLGPQVGQLLFREERVGELMAPLAVGVLFTCWQTLLSCVLNGLGRQRESARGAILSGGVELLLVYLLMWGGGLGLKGYAAAFLLSGRWGRR